MKNTKYLSEKDVEDLKEAYKTPKLLLDTVEILTKFIDAGHDKPEYSEAVDAARKLRDIIEKEISVNLNEQSIVCDLTDTGLSIKEALKKEQEVRF